MRYIILVLLGAASYGVLSTFVIFAYDQGFTVQQTVGAQNLFGWVMMGLVTGFFLLRRKRPTAGNVRQTARITGKTGIQLLIVGTTISLTGMLYYNSLQTIPASVAIVLLFQFTWIGVLLDAFIQRKKPGKTRIIAVLILFVGTLLAGNLVGGFGQLTVSGVVYGLLSAVSYSFFILFSGRVAPEAPAIKKSFIMATGSLLLAFIVYPPFFLIDGSLMGGLFLWAALLALFGVVIPTLFFAIGVPHIGGSLASVLGAAELPTAVILSAFVLRETVTALQWAGVIIILAGIAFPEWVRHRRKAKSSS